MTKRKKDAEPEVKFVTIHTQSYAPWRLMDQAVALVHSIEEHSTTYAVAVLLTLVKSFQQLAEEVTMWRSLWCDQPEDRLYHAKDRTWWKRVYGPKNMGHGTHPYSPYGASPPPEIMRIVRAARKLPRKSKQLANDLSHFPK